MLYQVCLELSKFCPFLLRCNSVLHLAVFQSKNASCVNSTFSLSCSQFGFFRLLASLVADPVLINLSSTAPCMNCTKSLPAYCNWLPMVKSTALLDPYQSLIPILPPLYIQSKPVETLDLCSCCPQRAQTC